MGNSGGESPDQSPFKQSHDYQSHDHGDRRSNIQMCQFKAAFRSSFGSFANI
jgi:hypothetical protein